MNQPEPSWAQGEPSAVESTLSVSIACRFSPTDRERVYRAVVRAKKAHSNQVRDDGTPYVAHPIRVAESLIHEFRVCDPDVICAAILHDVVEDQDQMTLNDIRAEFGDRVVSIVQTLTKPKGPRLSRDSVNKAYFKRLRHADEASKLVKLADKLDNVRDSVNSPSLTKRRRTAHEAQTFYLKLAAGLASPARRDIIMRLLAEAIMRARECKNSPL